MIFLGTGAAELYPNPFCACNTCTRARETGEIPRKRSALLYDAHTCVDFGPDILAASQQYDAPLCCLHDIFITHTHEDHLCFSNLEVLTMTPREGRTIRVWLSERGYDWVMAFLKAVDGVYPDGKCGTTRIIENGWLDFKPVTPYTWFETNGMKVYTVESNHRGCGRDEFAVNYVIEKPDGSRLLYVADSGLYSEGNLDVLKGFGCDTLVMEGTFGSLPQSRSSGHLNAENFVENVSGFLAGGIIKPDARIYVTHINQCNTFNHAEYQDYLDRHCQIHATVAYDGMKV